MSTKLEINIRTLITQCEEIVTENNKDWRLKKYIKSLDTMIRELDEDKGNCDEKCLAEYTKRCTNLKEQSNYVEKSNDLGEPKRPLRTKIKLKTVTDDYGDSVIKEINQIHNAKYHNELKKELLGGDDYDLRKRMTGGDHGVATTTKPDGMGEAVKYYGDMQEKIAQDMLVLTRNLKEQSETANRIINRDTEIVTKSTQLSDKNVVQLKSEAEKLQDHSKKAWKCWMWLMIGLVVMIFLGMVLFMKIVKKKTRV